MDVQWTLFELREMREHVDDLIRELESKEVGEDDWSVLQIQLEHILDHLCFAWNARDLSGEQRASLSLEEFERLAHAVPDMFGKRKIQ